MNRLEQIAISQLSENIHFRDYRKMYEGRLVYQDFDETMSVTKDIAKFRQTEASLPTHIKHFDIIGIIVNQLSGEFDSQKDKIRVDSLDQFSRGEFFREKNALLRKYVTDYFDLEMQRLLVISGHVPQEQFNSEEEKQAYLQDLERKKTELIRPDEIEESLQKNFQTVIAEWASHTLKADTIKWDMDSMDLEDLVDYLLTGRYFKHFHVGHDFYRPERWKPETTFFSKDLDIEYPQDGEYVGQVLFLSGADILQRYGHLLSEKQQKQLYGYDVEASSSNRKVSFTESLKRGFGDLHLIPDKSYYQRDLAFKMQDVFQQPMGKEYRYNEEGEQEARPVWLDNTHRYGHVGNSYASYLRDDIGVRDDVLQVIEAYWRGAKLIGLLTLENSVTNEPYQVEVEEDILKDFLKDNDIKQVKTVSLKEAKEKKEINTIAWFYVPQVWKGKKINAGNSNLKEDIIFDVEPLDFQIRGDSNLFDVKLPVAGIITSGVAQKIRPYQIEYNICMNQIRTYMEKEIGLGFMMDFNFLPSQYKNEFGETTKELIEEWREDLRELGFTFYDSSMANTGGQNPNAQIVQPINISFVNQMQNNMQMAEFWKGKALEQIGITPQRVGSPNEYESVEGTKQGVQASYAQTERIYRRFNTSKRKEREQHLYVAQYCVEDNKDITVDYLDPDHGRIIKNFSDDKFWLRKINVIPSNDSNQRKSLERFREMMLQNNTMNSDLLDYAKLFTSDSFITLLNYAQQSRNRLEKQTTEQRAHEQELMDKKLAAEQLKLKEERDFKASESAKERENNLREAEINAAAKIADNNFDAKYLDEIKKIASENQKEERENSKLDLQKQEQERKQDKDDRDIELALKKLKIETEKIKAQRMKSQNDLQIAIRNKN